jgi:hypothetical protein
MMAMTEDELRGLEIGDWILDSDSGRTAYVAELLNYSRSSIRVQYTGDLLWWQGDVHMKKHFIRIPEMPDVSWLASQGYRVTGEVVELRYGALPSRNFVYEGVVCSLSNTSPSNNPVYGRYRWIIEKVHPGKSVSTEAPNNTLEERATEHAMELFNMLERVDSSDFDCDWKAVQHLIIKVRTGVE